jgi:osmotically-inducible protein OsmY
LKHFHILGIVALIVTFGTAPALPQDTTTAPDNTKMNKRDRSKSSPTADNAKENKSDREIMKEIRQAIVKDKSLSTYAHNVKVIAQNGKVTLKGPVHSEDESKTIEKAAADVAGSGNVTNQLEVKGNNTAAR